MNPVCDVASDELIAFTEEELPERRMRELEAHVPSCSHCRNRLEGAHEISTRLRETMPEPESHSRHDLLVRLYQEANHQTDRPHRNWGQVASLTAVCGTFLLAFVLLWSGIGQFVDAIPQPFQQASQDQSVEWVAEENGNAEVFEAVSLPPALGEQYPLYDYWVQSGIRLIIYQTGEENAVSLEVSQFPVGEDQPPGYMEQISMVDGVEVYADDPDFIRELRWVDDGMAHHLQMYATEAGTQKSLNLEDAEQIIRAFFDG